MMPGSIDRVRAIIKKEWLDLSRNRVIVGTTILLPVLLTFMSCMMLITASRDTHPQNPGKIPDWLNKVAKDPREAAMLLLANTALMMFSMVPVILPSIMSAHSIVGEKLSRSLEPLLATPVRTWELLAGKLLAIVVPTLIPSTLGYVAYVAVAHSVSPPRVYELLLSAPFVLSIVLVGPLWSILAVTFGIMVSSRASDLQSAQGLSGLIVLPVIGMGMAQTFGALSATVTVVLGKALVLAVLDVGGLFLCTSVFERETILSRWK
jgi:ABC-2 type transport system permease protein